MHRRQQNRLTVHRPTSLSMKDSATSLGKKITGEELALVGKPTGIVDTGIASSYQLSLKKCLSTSKQHD